MQITFVTESHAFGDDKDSVDVALQSEVDSIKAHLKSMSDIIGATRGMVATARSENSQNNSAIHSVKTEMEACRKALDAVSVRVEKTDAKADKTSRQIAELPDKCEALFGKVFSSVFGDKLDVFARQITVLSKALERSEKNEKTLREMLDDANGQMKKLQNESVEMKKLLEENNRQIQDLKEKSLAMGKLLQDSQQALAKSSEVLAKMDALSCEVGKVRDEVVEKSKTMTMRMQSLESQTNGSILAAKEELEKRYDCLKEETSAAFAIVNAKLEKKHKACLDKCDDIKENILVPKKFANFLFIRKRRIPSK